MDYLARSRVQLLAENYKIDSTHLKWYAAFHNESHHPHIHLVVYSSQQSEGYLTKQGIDRIRSTLAHDIFRQCCGQTYHREEKETKTEIK
ncbi:MAG: relaxase MobL [Lachnospiraceae bacterium]|nr:relaxase MobL [Lachnospiraceae bacterium]